MNLSHAYGVPPSAEQGGQVLLAALDAGVTLFDTAALYGFGANEELVGRVLKPHRQQIVLTSKCGMTGVEGKRVIDGRPETLRQTCETACAVCKPMSSTSTTCTAGTDRCRSRIRLARWPICWRQAKSAASACPRYPPPRWRARSSTPDCRRAKRILAVDAQSGNRLLDACRAQNVALVAFSPLGRGFLAGGVRDPSGFAANDIRRAMPRFQAEHFARNLRLLDALQGLATETGFTLAQLAMGWLLAQSEQVIPIPGTSNVSHLQENLSADTVELSMEVLTRLDTIVNEHGERCALQRRHPAGNRYRGIWRFCLSQLGPAGDDRTIASIWV
jgi:aryl-alcohol dehydrogenase-like predicted oxidoreductase